MPSFWDPAVRDDLCRRVERLTPDSRAQWGKFDAAGMLAHLNDAMRMTMGELSIPPRKMLLRYTPIKQLVIYVLPFPKSAPTAPQLLVRCAQADLAMERAEFRTLAERAAAKASTDAWPEHPAFGKLSHKDWGVLAYRHTDHHLRQFGA
jgi:hypothetical protein